MLRKKKAQPGHSGVSLRVPQGRSNLLDTVGDCFIASFDSLRSLRITPRNDTFTLADLRAGESARIACIECEHAARCDRLIAYGLSEGQRITLIQHSPAFVIRVDETELALGAEIAHCIQIVRKNR